MHLRLSRDTAGSCIGQRAQVSMCGLSDEEKDTHDRNKYEGVVLCEMRESDG